MTESIKPRSVHAHILPNVRLDDPRTDHMDGYTDLRDPAFGERPARIHDMAVDDDYRIYLGENDNHERSSFLWSVRWD